MTRRDHAITQAEMELKTKEVLLAQLEHPDQQILQDVTEAKAVLNLAVDRHRQKKVVKRDSTYTPPVRSRLRKFVMTHTKKERKLAKAKIKAIKAARGAQRARRQANESEEELKRCREGDIPNGMVAAAESKMMEDRVAVRVAEEAVRIAEEQAQRYADKLKTAKARQAIMLQTKDEVQVSPVVKESQSKTHPGFSENESEPAGAVLGAKRELELTQLEAELERKRRKLIGGGGVRNGGMGKGSRDGDGGAWRHVWVLDDYLRSSMMLDGLGLPACACTCRNRPPAIFESTQSYLDIQCECISWALRSNDILVRGDKGILLLLS